MAVLCAEGWIQVHRWGGGELRSGLWGSSPHEVAVGGGGGLQARSRE